MYTALPSHPFSLVADAQILGDNNVKQKNAIDMCGCFEAIHLKLDLMVFYMIFIYRSSVESKIAMHFVQSNVSFISFIAWIL